MLIRTTDKIEMGRLLKRPILFILTFLAIACYASFGICSIGADLNKEGLKLMGEGKYRDAIVYFESALKAEPDNKNIQKNLSIAYHYLGIKYAANRDFQRAIQNEKQALKYDSENNMFKEQLSLFLNNYALSYAAKKRYDLAQSYFEEALAYTPDSPTVNTNLYNILLNHAQSSNKKKNIYKAKRLSEEAISFMPDKPSAYILLGNIYYNEDNFKETLKYWNKAIEIEPNNTTLGKRIEKLKKEKEVEEDFKTRKRQHFRIRFDKELDSEYVWAISDILEDARRNIRNEFSLSSTEIVPVIVYTKEQFNEATSMPHWTLGLYDGKIRIREQDIAQSDKLLRKTLSHEYRLRA